MRVNILLCVSENWIAPAKVTICSVKENLPVEADLRVYLLYDKISGQALDELAVWTQSVCQAPSQAIHVPHEMFAGYNCLSWSRETFFRLGAPYLLPENVDRVLYLDADVLAINSIEAFYMQDWQGCCCAAFQDICAEILLINSAKIRRDGIEICQITDTYERNKDQMKYPDQDINNILFRDRLKVMLRDYSCIYISEARKITEKFMEFIKENGLFIHFIGPKKPWTANTLIQ